MCAMIEKLRMRSEVISPQNNKTGAKPHPSILGNADVSSAQRAKHALFSLSLQEKFRASRSLRTGRPRSRLRVKSLLQRYRSAPVAVCRCNQRKPTSIRRRYPGPVCLLRDGHCPWLWCRRMADELQRQSLRR